MKLLYALLLLLPVSAWAQTTPQAPVTTADISFGSACAYPDTARTTNSTGATLVSYRGTHEGRVEDVKVIQSSGHADLDDAAMQCVGRWRFKPDDPAEKLNIGTHRINILWSIPDTSAGAPPSVGRLAGIAHTCLEYYPKSEAKAGIEGKTLLRFTITDEGEVRDEAVDQSSGNANLDAAALQCVRTWRYRPAVQDGKPVAVSWKAYVVWKLEIPQPPPFAEPPRDCLHSYPVKAEDLAGIEGTTEVSFDIVRGEVRDVSVTHSSGNAALDRAAVACIGSRRYVREFVTMKGMNVDKFRLMTIRERINWGDALKTGK
jgi:TonB family protein